ncbi:MAG: hypothetical protein HYZ42_01485 [Bacteroidetes bacterium]|nr:hypothetical protein [Bacteroidota bacterium]
MKKYLIGSVLLTLVSMAITMAVQSASGYDLRLTYFGIIYFAILNIFVFFIGTLGVGKSNNMFMKSFYTGFYLQLFLSIAGLLIYLIFSKEKSKPFIISYLICYILFTAFEIYHLLITLRAVSKNTQTIEK